MIHGYINKIQEQKQHDKSGYKPETKTIKQYRNQDTHLQEKGMLQVLPLHQYRIELRCIP
ncbi:hypothetical protein D9M68_850890 [compost metagenome]